MAQLNLGGGGVFCGSKGDGASMWGSFTQCGIHPIQMVMLPRPLSYL